MAIAQAAGVSILRSPTLPGVELMQVEGGWMPESPRVVFSYELATCDAGEVEMFRGGRTLRLAPGVVSLAEPGEVVRVIWHSPLVRYRAVHIDPTALQAPAGGTEMDVRSHFREPQVVDADLGERLNGVIDAIKGLVPVGEQQRRLAALLEHVVSHHCGDSTRLPRVRPKTETVRRVREYLEYHYAENVPLSALARQVGVKTSYLIRLFRAHVGLPPHAYQARVRVNRARTLLRQGVRPADVATETGFADQSHLTRQFRRVVGVTPGRYQGGSL